MREKAQFPPLKYQYMEPGTGKDQGINVREKAKTIIELLESSDRLTEERCDLNPSVKRDLH